VRCPFAESGLSGFVPRHEQTPPRGHIADFRRYKGGIVFWEGSKACAGEEILPQPGLDSLYWAETWNRSLDPTCGAPVGLGDGAICGLRYQSTLQDTLEGRQHGRIIVFDFEPSLFLESEIAQARAPAWIGFSSVASEGASRDAAASVKAASRALFA